MNPDIILTIDNKKYKLILIEEEQQDTDINAQTPKLQKITTKDDDEGNRTYIYKKSRIVNTKAGPVNKETEIRRTYHLSTNKNERKRIALEAIDKIRSEDLHFKNSAQRYDYYVKFLNENYKDSDVKPYSAQTFDNLFRS